MMDIEKIKKNYSWDPAVGDYSKDYVAGERRMQRRKKNRKLLFTMLYIALLISAIVILYRTF